MGTLTKAEKLNFKKGGKKIVDDNVKSFVSLKDINKIYPNGIQAVYDFNIDIHHHDFIVLVGPSGCGKSTTLRMVAGLEDISSGSLYIDKVLSNYVASKDRDISMVFQSYALYPQMTVYENIAFPLKARVYDKVLYGEKHLDKKDVLSLLERPNDVILAKAEALDKKLNYSSVAVYVSTKLHVRENAAKILLSFRFNDADELLALRPQIEDFLAKAIAEEDAKLAKDGLHLEEGTFKVLDKDGAEIHHKVHLTKEEIRQKVFEAAEILDLGPYLDRKPKELSGGQMQRVALGRAIVRNAKLFLMDEPLSNLDAKLRVQMRSEIVRIHEKIGATTIYVTHDQTEAMTMATRIAVMSKGWVQQIDVPQVIYNNPNNIFVATFIGSPAMNIFDGTYDNGTLVFNNGFKLKLDDDYVRVHNDFYNRKIAQTENFLNTDAVKKMHGLLVHTKLQDLLAKTPAELAKNEVDSDLKNEYKLSKENGQDPKKYTSQEIKELTVKKTNEIKDRIKSEGPKLVNELRDIVNTITDEDKDTLLQLLDGIDFESTKVNATILKNIKSLLLNIRNITSKELSILHNAQVFKKDKKEDHEEVLFYNKRRGKAKKAVKGYKNLIHVKDSNIVLTNNLYLVLTNLLEKYKSFLNGAHPVRIGIRPEHIHLDNEYNDPNKSEAFTIQSDVVELLGSELLLHSNWNDVDMIAKISTGTLVKHHENVDLSIDTSKVLVFDANSGDTIADWVKED